MIRIAITEAAFEAIAQTLPLGSVGYENEVNERGERLIWLEPTVVQPPQGHARPRRELQRRHPADLGDGAPLMSSESPSAFTEAERQAFAFAEEVGGLAVRIVGAAVAEVVFEREADPKLYAT